jgi:uncharacterized protein YcbX
MRYTTPTSSMTPRNGSPVAVPDDADILIVRDAKERMIAIFDNSKHVISQRQLARLATFTANMVGKGASIVEG